MVLSNILQVENPTRGTGHAPERASVSLQQPLVSLTIRNPITSHYMCEISVLWCKQ